MAHTGIKVVDLGAARSTTSDIETALVGEAGRAIPVDI